MPGERPNFQPDEGVTGHKETDVTRQRYHELTDKKFLQGLSEGERREQQALGDLIDKQHEPFYTPIINRLRAIVAKRGRSETPQPPTSEASTSEKAPTPPPHNKPQK